MIIYVLAGLSLVLLTFLWGKNQYRIIYLKKLGLPLIYIIFIVCLILFSKTAVSSASRGLKLWFEIVIPSLLPFFVVSELLSKTGFIRASGVLLEPIMRPIFNLPGCSSFVFILGILSGNPVGAKMVSIMRKDGLLTRTESERLLAFSNNSGPLFIVGAVSVGMFKMPSLGLFLLLCHIAASITVGIILRYYKFNLGRTNHNANSNLFKKFKRELLANNSGQNGKSGFWNSFGEAIRSSVMTLLIVGGFITVFSVIINILLETGIIWAISDLVSPILLPLGVGREMSAAIISGFFEITTGVNMASSAVGANLIQKLIAVSFIIGWSGLSVHSQVFSIVADTDISIIPYVFGKFLQGIFAALYAYIGIKTAGSLFLKATPAFLHAYTSGSLTWQNYFINSCITLFQLSVFITIICFIILFLNYLFNKIKKVRLF